MQSKADLRIKKLQDQVFPLFQKYGPLCDSEGFYNHFGECWVDSIQMIFLFSDPIKGVLQRELLNSTIDEEYVANKVQGGYEKFYGLKDPSTKQTQIFLSYLIEFLKAFQLRFLRHYLMEYTRFQEIKKEDKCSFEDLQGKMAFEKILETSFLQRSQGREGFRSALFSQRFDKYKNKDRFKITPSEGYIAGGAVEINNLIVLLKNIFLPFRGIKIIGSSPRFYESYFKRYLNANIFACLMGRFEHLTCFYICGGHPFYFDDNQGNLPFQWKEFMTFFKMIYLSASAQKKSLPIFFFGGMIYMYDIETDKDFFKFSNFPILEYEAEDGTHLYTKLFVGNDKYETIDFVVPPKGKETNDYRWEEIVGKNKILVVIKKNYYLDKGKRLDDIVELIDTITIKRLPPTSKFNIQTGQFLGTRLNQPLPQRVLYRAELNAFLKILKTEKDGKKRIDQKLENQITPLQTALFLRDIDSVKILLEYGANPNLYNNVRTPIQDAIVFESSDLETDSETRKETTFQLVKLLVEAGADINKENGRKRTALWYAVDFENPKVYNYLLQKGAIVQGKNFQNRKSPMNLIRNQIQRAKETPNKRMNLLKNFKTLKNRREAQEPLRRLITQLTRRNV